MSSKFENQADNFHCLERAVDDVDAWHIEILSEYFKTAVRDLFTEQRRLANELMKLEAKIPVWVKELPTKEGVYWYRDDPKKTPRPAHVTKGDLNGVPDLLAANFPGDDELYALEGIKQVMSTCEWAGPLMEAVEAHQ